MRRLLFSAVLLLAILFGIDRAALVYAQHRIAIDARNSEHLSTTPTVHIRGFPFLTQLAARTFNTVNVNASNETAGPGGQLEIASLTATLHGMHIHGTNSATVDQFTASALVTFTALAHAGGIPQGITLASGGGNQIKATVDILGFSSEATAKVTQVGNDKINPGQKIFTLRAIGQSGWRGESTRWFQMNFAPDTWFAGPDPNDVLAGWRTFQDSNGKRYWFIDMTPTGWPLPGDAAESHPGVPGTMLGRDSATVRIVPALTKETICSRRF